MYCVVPFLLLLNISLNTVKKVSF